VDSNFAVAMSSPQYILVDAVFQQQVLTRLDTLTKLLEENYPKKADSVDWMDNADLMQYLRISRRTALTLRQKGLPHVKIDDGKIFYSKKLVDQFLLDNQIIIKPKN
jgi:hypothetical protein